jgi:hypothetical protein
MPFHESGRDLTPIISSHPRIAITVIQRIISPAAAKTPNQMRRVSHMALPKGFFAKWGWSRESESSQSSSNLSLRGAKGIKAMTRFLSESKMRRTSIKNSATITPRNVY